MLRIGVNTRLLIKDQLDGIGWYQYEVLKRITKANPSHLFIFFFDRKFDPSFVFEENVVPVVLRPQARHPILFKFWFNHVIRKALTKYKIDVFFSPDGYICLNTNVPQVGTFHDLNFEHFSKDLRPSHSRYYRSQFPLFAKKSQHLITVSNFSKNDIIERYGVTAEKITVIYNGVNNNYCPIQKLVKDSCRNKYSAGAPFFLHVGSLHSRKNIVRLIEAFNTFKKKSRSNTKLILAGNKYDWTPAMEDALNSSGYKDEIILTGRIYQADLIELMGSALALTYVSYFEGFGLPVLEAMRSGTPVITSDCTSIPEVAGGAALMIDPFKVDAIAEAMSKVEASQELRLELIDKGKKQVALFNWDRCAEETWKVIENTHKNATIKP